jgi:hypothetical protein
MSMGWTFQSFEPERWRAWTSGRLTPEMATRFRQAVLWDEAEPSSVASAGIGGLVERVVLVGIERSFHELAEAEHPGLDSIVESLFRADGLVEELGLRGYTDPWNWAAMEALVSPGPATSSGLLLTGRRLVTGAPMKESHFVLYSPAEAVSLSDELGRAMREYQPPATPLPVQEPVVPPGGLRGLRDRMLGMLGAAGPTVPPPRPAVRRPIEFEAWELEELTRAMNEMGEDARGGRAVFAHFG